MGLTTLLIRKHVCKKAMTKISIIKTACNPSSKICIK